MSYKNDGACEIVHDVQLDTVRCGMGRRIQRHVRPDRDVVVVVVGTRNETAE